MSRPALEVADIFRDYGPAWRLANAGHVSLEQLKVMSAIERCRTAAFGGHVLRCENDNCQHTLISYNSCLMGKLVMGSWQAHASYPAAVSANPSHHYEAPLSRAISLSGARKAPRRRCGGTMVSIASSFSVGSPRV